MRLVFGCGFDGFAALRARDFARVYLRSAPVPGQGAGAFWPAGVLDIRGLLAAVGDKVRTGRVVAHTGLLMKACVLHRKRGPLRRMIFLAGPGRGGDSGGRYDRDAFTPLLLSPPPAGL